MREGSVFNLLCREVTSSRSVLCGLARRRKIRCFVLDGVRDDLVLENKVANGEFGEDALDGLPGSLDQDEGTEPMSALGCESVDVSSREALAEFVDD